MNGILLGDFYRGIILDQPKRYLKRSIKKNDPGAHGPINGYLACIIVLFQLYK